MTDEAYFEEVRVDETDREIENYLKALPFQKKNSKSNITNLLISVIAFISVGLFKNSLPNILILVAVLFIHELGHFIGMRLFKYRDVHMLFIPLFGAATAGYEIAPNGSRKAIVSLLGPLPGIFLGIIFWILCFKTRHEIFIQPARTLLFINAFNLLPIFPLDGGRFIDTVLFSRNPKIEVVFQLVMGLLLLSLAFIMKGPFLGIFAVLVLVSLYPAYMSASIAKKIKTDMPPPTQITEQPPIQYIAEIKRLLRRRESFQKLSVKTLAKHIQNVWQKVCNKPPSAGASFGLMFVYLMSLSIGLISPLMFEGVWAASQVKREIKILKMENGQTAKQETMYFKGKVVRRIEISPDDLFHGKVESFDWNTGVLKETGQWYHGKWDGEWSFYDKSGKLYKVMKFDKGHFISQKELTTSGWIEKSFNELPKFAQWSIKREETGPPNGIKHKRKSLEELVASRDAVSN